MKSHVYPRRDLGPDHQDTQEATEQGNTYLSNQQGRIEHGKTILLMWNEVLLYCPTNESKGVVLQKII